MTQELELIEPAAPAQAPQRALTGPASPDTLLALAVQQGASIEQLERLMALKERHEANEARKAFHEAMAGFKAEPPAIFKDKHVKYANSKGGFTEYDHATLGNVVKTVIAAMGRHGLSHSWSTAHLEGGRVRVTCKVTHKLGHSDEVSLEASRDDSGGKNNIQALGSAISYLQRYTLLAITGLATEDDPDDDGAGAEANDPMLTGFRNAAMDGTDALRAHYNKTLPPDDWWGKNSKALKEAAKKADAEVAQ